MSLTGVIYKATNIINGKSYIGQTVNFEQRKNSHLKKKSEKCKYAFHRAIEKYGKDAFEWTILEENIPKDQLNEREVYWIAYYDTFNNGYNETLGGENAECLVEWKKEHPEEVHKYALNGLTHANKYWEAHPEERLQLARAMQKKGVEAVKKKVRCVELDLIFDSLTDAERWSQTPENPNGKKATHQHIAHVCRGHRHTCGGYHWEYVDVKE